MTDERTIDLSLTGMTCNACAMNIERGLTALDGVAATVNFAAESARVSIANPSITSERLISVV